MITIAIWVWSHDGGRPSKLLIVLLGVFLSVIWLVIGLLITGLKPKTNIIRLMLILFWLAIGLLFVGTDCFVRVEASARLNYPAGLRTSSAPARAPSRPCCVRSLPIADAQAATAG